MLSAADPPDTSNPLDGFINRLVTGGGVDIDYSRLDQEIALLRRRLIHYDLAARPALIYSTRDYEARQRSVVFGYFGDYIATPYAVLQLADNGLVLAARRELRYLLDVAVRHLYAESALPAASRADRLKLLTDTQKHKLVARSNAHEPIIDRFTPWGLGGTNLVAYRNYVVDTYKKLSEYAHLTKVQLQSIEALMYPKDPASGVALAKEAAKLGRIAQNVLEIALVTILHALGPASAGDILVGMDEYEWDFRKMRFTGAMDRLYDYKVERKQKVVRMKIPLKPRNDT